MAAEDVLAEGKPNVILVNEGFVHLIVNIRNILDIAIPCCGRLTHLPIMIDPSHGTGWSEYAINEFSVNRGRC
jgi:3-deoxy-7-phosphoheptulonate synthase